METNLIIVPELGVDVLLEYVGAIVVFGVGGIVTPAIGKHPSQIRDEEPFVRVVVGLKPIRHRFQVCRK